MYGNAIKIFPYLEKLENLNNQPSNLYLPQVSWFLEKNKQETEHDVQTSSLLEIIKTSCIYNVNSY